MLPDEVIFLRHLPCPVLGNRQCETVAGVLNRDILHIGGHVVKLGVVEQSHQSKVIKSYRLLTHGISATMESRDEEDVVVRL